jgi:site-specific DNA-cytosine methylase
MKVLIACEESQAITKEFRKLGVEAYSCDILACSGGHPEWHIQGDAIKEAYSFKYDLMVAHPPCTYLSVSGNRWLYNKDGSRNKERWENRSKALAFVNLLMNAPIKHIVIENPISVISSQIRKPDQIIQPFMFGDKASKSTCLWLKNLDKIVPTNIVEKGEFFEWVDKNGKKKRQAQWYMDALSKAKSNEERRTLRSKTFLGMAKAIANQLTNQLTNNKL